MKATRLPHNLLIHVDFGPALERVEIRYSYPFSTPHRLPEQLLKLDAAGVPPRASVELERILTALRSRVTAPQRVRLPHGTVTPEVQLGVATVVIQDATRDLPVARLYWYERVPAFPSNVEHEVRMEPGDWTVEEMAAWQRLRQGVKALVWNDYQDRFGALLE